MTKHEEQLKKQSSMKGFTIEYCLFMNCMMNAPFDRNICPDCGGTGLKPVYCCNGFDCGCRGMPVDFIECDCGIEPPSIEKILEWKPEKK